MKSTFAAMVFLVTAGLPAAAVCAAGDDIIPKALPQDRYDKLASQSPFTPPTAPVQAVKPPPAPPWTSKYTVVGVRQDNKNSSVTVLDRDTNERFQVSTDPDIKNTRDLALASVRWSDRISDTKVTLRRGVSDFGEVPFDAGMAAPAAPGMAFPNGAMGRQGMINSTPNRIVNQAANNPAPQPLNNNMRRPAMVRSAPPAIPGEGGPRAGISLPTTNTQAPQRVTTRPAVTNNDDDDDE